MNPALKAGDGLFVVPYKNRKVRIGDVVVFRDFEGKYNIVHRVVAVDSRGITTKGDNNIDLDPWVLLPDDIIGRVVSVQRNSKTVTIRGGIWGRMFAAAFRTIKQVNLLVSKIFHPVYHWFARSGILIKFNWLLPRLHVLSFSRPEGREFQLLMGNRVIGRCLPGKDHWQIAPPLRLFVDEASLPT
jgi:signal peptidase